MRFEGLACHVTQEAEAVWRISSPDKARSSCKVAEVDGCYLCKTLRWRGLGTDADNGSESVSGMREVGRLSLMQLAYGDELEERICCWCESSVR